MAKTYEEKGFFGKQNYLTEQAERYGIDLDEYEVNGNNSGREFNDNLKSMSDLENEIARNMSMDYDVRESIAAGLASGDKRFEGLGDGISNIGEAYGATKAMQKYHKNELGNTGNFSSANDYSNVSASLQGNYIDQIKKDITDGLTDSSTPDKDKDEPEEETHTGSYYDHVPGSLEEATAKATSGFNADGTPAQKSAEQLLSETMAKTASDSEKMGQGKFNQGMYALTNLGSRTFQPVYTP